jgi:membrane protease YdiL (CAAX protease family)
VSSPSPWGPPSPWAPPDPYGSAIAPPHPTYPLWVGIGAVLTLAGSLTFARWLLDQIVDHGWPIAAYVALGAAIGYGPVLAWCIVATRRASAQPWQQRFGIEFRRVDLGWGPLVWIATFGVQIVVAMIILATRIPVRSNLEGIEEGAWNRTYVVTTLLLAVIAAPIVEEIAFRAVVLRSLLSRLAPVPAIAVQAVLFGVAHIDPVRGIDNIGIAMVTGAIGASFGAAAYWLRRIPPTMIAHAIINGLALTLVLTGAVDPSPS